MSIQVDEVTLPAYWASALVNGDESGMNDEESAQLTAWYADNPTLRVVDVARDADGVAFDPRFAHDICDGSQLAGDILDYVVHIVNPTPRT